MPGSALGQWLDRLSSSDVDVEIDHYFDFNKDFDTFKKNPNNSALITRLRKRYPNEEDFKENLSKNQAFIKARRNYHWNILRITYPNNPPCDADSVKELCRQLLNSKTLLLTQEQIEALAYLTGVGVDKLTYSQMTNNNDIPDYENTNFISEQPKLQFERCDVNTVALELILRVISPSFIDQGQESLCGPATLMQIIARSNPLQYVDYVVKLAREGLAKLSADPSQPEDDKMAVDIRGADYSNLRKGESSSMPQADYIAIASLRARDNVIDKHTNSFNSLLFGVTFTYEIKKWMEKSGFFDVHDVQVAGTLPELKSQIQILSRLISRGYDVCLCTSASFASKLRQGYDLALMPANITQIEANKIYLELEGNQLNYSLQDPNDNLKIISGSIPVTNLKSEVFTPLSQEQLTDSLQAEILAITSDRGETQIEEILPPNFAKHWVDGHFVHLKGINLDKNNNDYVYLKISTWGSEVTRRLPLAELKDFFKGNSAQVGITYSKLRNYERTLASRVDKTGKGHPYVQLKYIRNHLIGNDWKGDLVDVEWNVNGKLETKSLPKDLAPLVPILNQLRPSLTYTESLGLIIQLKNLMSFIPGYTCFKTDFLEGSNFKIIESCNDYIAKNRSAIAEIAPMLASLVVEDKELRKNTITTALKAEVENCLKEDFTRFRGSLEDYRKHLVKKIDKATNWQWLSEKEKEEVRDIKDQIEQGEIINENLAWTTSSAPRVYETLGDSLNKLIKRANAVNRALHAAPLVRDNPNLYGYAAFCSEAKNSLFCPRAENEGKSDYEIIQEDRSTSGYRVIRAILTIFSCLFILPIGYYIAKAMVNKERKGEFSLYIPSDKKYARTFFDCTNTLPKRLTDNWDKEKYIFKLSYEGEPQEVNDNELYVFKKDGKLMAKVKGVEAREIYLSANDTRAEGIMAVLASEGRETFSVDQKTFIQHRLSRMGYSLDEQQSGELNLR